MHRKTRVLLDRLCAASGVDDKLNVSRRGDILFMYVRFFVERIIKMRLRTCKKTCCRLTERKFDNDDDLAWQSNSNWNRLCNTRQTRRVYVCLYIQFHRFAFHNLISMKINFIRHINTEMHRESAHPVTHHTLYRFEIYRLTSHLTKRCMQWKLRISFRFSADHNCVNSNVRYIFLNRFTKITLTQPIQSICATHAVTVYIDSQLNSTFIMIVAQFSISAASAIIFRKRLIKKEQNPYFMPINNNNNFSCRHSFSTVWQPKRLQSLVYRLSQSYFIEKFNIIVNSEEYLNVHGDTIVASYLQFAFLLLRIR